MSDTVGICACGHSEADHVQMPGRGCQVCDCVAYDEVTPTPLARQLLTGSETVDESPPYRCVPPPHEAWLEAKIQRVDAALTAAERRGHVAGLREAARAAEGAE